MIQRFYALLGGIDVYGAALFMDRVNPLVKKMPSARNEGNQSAYPK